MAFEERLRGRSLWLDVLPGPLSPRPPLEGDREADVAIVGGGFTGLWTAYSLVRADPALRVVVVEAEGCGFGASGRNGGFVSAGIAGQAAVYERSGGLEGVIRAERVMIEAIDEIGRVVADEHIDCGWVKGGSLRLAMNEPQLARIHAALAAKRRLGLDEDDVRIISPEEIRQRVAIEGAIGGTVTPHCARVNPAALARGLAEALERRGVTIFEQSPATAITAGSVTTAFGVLRAPVVLRATEAFTTRLAGSARRFLPLGSHMIATEPLPAEVWHAARLGRARDARRPAPPLRLRAADARRPDRPRRSRAVVSVREPISARTIPRSPRSTHGSSRPCGGSFPAAAEARITHRWGGVFAAPRDWSMGVGFDPEHRARVGRRLLRSWCRCLERRRQDARRPRPRS